MSRSIVALSALALALVTAPALASERYQVDAQVRVSQGRLGELKDGVAEETRARCVLEVTRRKGAEVQGLVREERTDAAGRAPKPVPFKGQLGDLAWVYAPRLLAPLAEELRNARPGERRVELSVVGYAVPLRLRAVALKSSEGRGLQISGSGETAIGKTGVTLRLQVRGRVVLLPNGCTRVELRLRWTAKGGPGADTESRVHLKVRTSKLEESGS